MEYKYFQTLYTAEIINRGDSISHVLHVYQILLKLVCSISVTYHIAAI